MHDDMTPHERKAFEEIQKWKAGGLRSRQWLPTGVRGVLERGKSAAGDTWDKVPRNAEITAAVQAAMDGGFRFVNDAAASSLNRDRLVTKFHHVDPAPQELEDLRQLDLREIDRRMPNLAMRYAMGAMAEGVGAGFVMGAGAAAGAVGALPAFGVVAGTLVADTVTLLGGAARVNSHYGAYCGYDTRKPAEALYMMSLMSVASASGQAGKQAAMAHVRQLANMLARRATWVQLNEQALVKLTQRMFTRLGELLTKRKLGQIVPVFGAGIAGGLNYQFVRSAGDTAYFLYRERFLIEKYGLDDDAAPRSDGDIIDVEVLTDQIIEETSDPAQADSHGDGSTPDPADDDSRDDT